MPLDRTFPRKQVFGRSREAGKRSRRRRFAGRCSRTASTRGKSRNRPPGYVTEIRTPSFFFGIANSLPRT